MSFGQTWNQARLAMTMIRYASKGIAQGVAKVSLDSLIKRKQPPTERAAEEGIRQLEIRLVHSVSMYCQEGSPVSWNCYQAMPSWLRSPRGMVEMGYGGIVVHR